MVLLLLKVKHLNIRNQNTFSHFISVIRCNPLCLVFALDFCCGCKWYTIHILF